MSAKKSITDADILAKLRAHLARAGLNQKEFAAGVGLSPPYMSDIMCGRRDIPYKIAAMLGYRKTWVRT